MIRKLLYFVRSLFLNFSNSSKEKSFRPSLRLLCLGMFFTASFANATTYYSRANGDFATRGTWSTSPTGSPINATALANNDVFIIQAAHTVSTTSSPICAGITILGILNMGNNTLTVNGDVSGTGTWQSSGGINNTRTVSLTGNWLFTGTSTGTGAIANFTGAASQTLTGRISSVSSGTLRVNKGGGSVILGNALTVATFTNTAGTFDASTSLLTATTATLTAGTLRVGAANWGTNYSFTPTPATGFTIDYYNTTPTINAAITYQNLTFSGAGTTADPSGNLIIQGNLANTGGGIIDFNNKNVTISGGNTQNIVGFTTTGNVIISKSANTATLTGAMNGTDLTINNPSRLALGGSTHTFTGNWAMTGGTIDANTSTLRVKGNITGVAGSFNFDTGTVDLYGADQSIRQLNFYKLTLSGTGSKTLTAAATINNNLEIGLGVKANLGTFTHSANTLTLGGATQDLGSWGSTGSSASNKNDNYFTVANSGIVNVGKTYCSPNFGNVRPITNVVFNTISNASSALTTSPVYENYINYKTNVTIGGSYTITIQGNTNGNNTQIYTVYFDWNQNGVFTDSGESFAIGSFSNSTGIDGTAVSTSITVPNGALLGTTRMRIVSRSGSTSSCPTSGNGQAEDYSVNIEAACSAPAPGLTNATANPVCPGVPFTLSVQNPGSGGATYQWETSTNGLDPWLIATPAPVTIINTDFSTIPGNATTIGSSTVISGNELILTPLTTGYYGGYVINTTPGSNITPFTASFDYRIFDGGGADGMSLSYGPNIDSGTAGGGEEGEGAGFILKLDTYDNVTGQNTGSMIRIFYGGAQIFANSLNPFNLRNSSYRNVTLTVDANGLLSLRIAGTLIVSGLSVPSYVAADKTSWKFKFSARVGAVNDRQSINKIFIQCGDVLSNNSTFTTSQTALTHYRAKVTCGTNSAYSTPVIVSMSSVSITTQPTTPATTCSGTGAQTLTVAATGAGLTYTWKKGTVTLVNDPIISGQGTATLTLTNPTTAEAGNNYNVVITGGCSSSVTSDNVTVNVNAFPTAPTASVTTQPTCAAPTGVITITNPAPASGISYSINGSDYTNTSGVFNGVAVGTYNVTVKSSDCISSPTPLSVNAAFSKVWTGNADGNWSNPANWNPATIPTDSDCIVIPNVSGPLSVPTIQGTGVVANAYTVNVGNNGSLTVNATNTLKVVGSVTVAATGSLTFQDDASLVQTTNAANTGNIIYKRDTDLVRRYDFTYWSSPITRAPSFTLHDLSPNTLLDKYAVYNPVKAAWDISLNGIQPMTPGVGYMVRAPQSFSITVPSVYPATFTGVPNNGDYPVQVTATKWFLIGNPYPSAIDADKFILLNHNATPSVDVGSLYFWTHNTPPADNTGTGIYTYSSNDYAVFNSTGGTNIGAKLPDGSFEPGPTGEIAACQSFFMKASGPNDVMFTNAMRIDGKNNQFYKTSKSNTIEKNRIWLNFTNAQGAYKQALVGYIEGATNSWDVNYDATTINGNSFIDFYSVNEAQKLAIQGRALPFTDTDKIPLGYKTTVAGDFTIAIDHVDGLFNNQAIYLEDKTTGIVTDLRAGNYTFTTAIGTFIDRFALSYTKKTLGTGDFENLENSVFVSIKEKTIKVTSTKETIKEVTIYDISGNLLYNKKKIGSAELQIPNLQSSNQVLLVKVTLENDYTTTKKIIFQ